MRAWFLLVLAPAIALADASTPERPSAPSAVTIGERAVTVGFGAGDGGALVTTRTTDDGEHTRKTRYRFEGRVFVDVSKRPTAGSK